jgi:hypothetical protein
VGLEEVGEKLGSIAVGGMGGTVRTREGWNIEVANLGARRWLVCYNLFRLTGGLRRSLNWLYMRWCFSHLRHSLHRQRIPRCFGNSWRD